MLSVLKMYFQFGSAYRDRLYKGLLFTILTALFEGLQITALWIVFDALVKQALSGQTALIALGVMLVSIVGTFVCSHFKSELLRRQLQHGRQETRRGRRYASAPADGLL